MLSHHSEIPREDCWPGAANRGTLTICRRLAPTLNDACHPAAAIEDAAYVIYTSGSTGGAKGRGRFASRDGQSPSLDVGNIPVFGW